MTPDAPGPTVSVVIPAYNAERYVGEALASVLAQTYPVREIVVVDDGSTDGTLDVVRRMESAHAGRVHVITGPNRGGSAARNRGLAEVSAEYVSFLDADDVLLPEKIERDVDVLRQHPAPLLFGSFEGYEGGQKIYERDTFDSPNPWICLVQQNFGHTSANLFRAEAVRAVGGWDEGRPYNQEYDLMIRLLQADSRVAFARHKATHVRRVPGSVSYAFTSAMREARLALDADALGYLRGSGDLEAVAAFERQLFLYVRQLYELAPKRAIEWHDRLFRTPPALDPRSHTAAYRVLYRTLGFATAERIKARVKTLRHTLRPSTILTR